LRFLALNLVFTTVNAQFFAVPVIIGGIAAAMYAGKCYVTECCTERWITANITGLQHDLDNRVFGQHLATAVVIRAVTSHLRNPSPEKALTLYFGGCRGCGKTFVSRIIAANIFKEGMDSKYVNLILATIHFKHKDNLNTYKDMLQKWVIESIKKCPRSLFIFDGVDKMPEGLIDVLGPFLEHYQGVEGVDCRKSMFIFLSNNADTRINAAVLDHFRDGKLRHEITLKQMKNIVENGSYNVNGGFEHSTLIKQHLIDVFVPFLPLERKHIMKCAEVELKARNHPVTSALLIRIADKIKYFPKDGKVAFSTSGCTGVHWRITILISDMTVHYKK